MSAKYTCWRNGEDEEDSGRVMEKCWSAHDAAEEYAEALCDDDPEYYSIYEVGDEVVVKDEKGVLGVYTVYMTSPRFISTLKRD
jgi:hypothetical protein